MLAASAERILTELGPEDLVLDVGGWASPFGRADWVLDIMPYETRGLYGVDLAGEERFTAETWVQMDICDRDSWPFGDRQFDFAICAQTLEDVRDPVGVCRELQRVAKAGYVEVPSRLEEQSHGFQGPWVGWGHHHWLIELTGDGLEFVFKHHVIHARRQAQFPREFWTALAEEDKVVALWWSDGFTARERIFHDAEGLYGYLCGFVAAHGPCRAPPGPLAKVRKALRSGAD